MKRVISIFFLLAAFQFAKATHNRAGEITFRHVGGSTSLEYEITITTYTKTTAPADRPVLDSVHFGDGTLASFNRINGPIVNGFPNGDTLSNNVKVNIYKRNHIYPGSGIYDIYFIDPDRNEGVVNIPNSVNTPFAIHATLYISPRIFPDNSPVLLNPPIDRGCVDVPFVHNPNAYDPDGDSLSFELTTSRGDGNLPIPGYTLPYAPVSFSIDPVTGQLVWNYPTSGGAYQPPYEVNVAFEVKEWRHGHLIGVVERDMQITISTCSNHPPQIQSLQDTCVLANDSIGISVTATDPDHNLIKLTSTGGPYNQVPAPQAQFSTNPSTPYSSDTVTGTFSWTPACVHVRHQPYQVQFKAQDTLTDGDMADIKSFFITVIGPAPTNLTTTPNGNTIQLHWDPDVCPQATKYKIYHRSGLYPGIIECPCQTGVPSFTGYTLIGTTSGLNNTNFIDDNNGQGLAIGVEHCYMVVAVFSEGSNPDGSESCASNQACAHLIKDLPVITNASVDTTDINIGAMYVAWSKPSDLDTIQYPPPYQYKLYHASNFTTQSPTLIATFFNLDDTIYYDENLNTDADPYSYYVELYYNNAGTPALKGKSSDASSVYLKLTPTDRKIILNWEEHVPWGNYRCVIFRLNTFTSVFDSIAEIHSTPDVSTHTYADTGLVNGTQYCYYVKSVGTYGSTGILDTLINLSEQKCATAIDNVPPCAPRLSVLSDCVAEENILTWTNLNLSCADDVIKYNIYFSPDSSSYEVIAVVTPADSTSFIHSNLTVLSGCYKVTAIDSAGNESTADAFCVDTCRQYVLPSVFTPNGDGNNDFFHPCDSTTSEQLQKKNCPPYKNVKDIDIKIFNRWGNLVFETTDKNINWDGKNQFSKGDCPDGVYYYTCKVNFFRFHGTETKELHGYIHLMREK